MTRRAPISIEQVKAFIAEQVPFNKHLGIRCVAMEHGSCRLFLPFVEHLVGDPFRPALHGGVLSTLIDTCGGAAVWTGVKDDDRVSTIDLRVDYLRPGPLADLACDGTVVRIGNRVGVADMRVFAVDDEATTIAVGKGVYSIRRAG